MTPEQRLDRLERIFLLFVGEGLRVRTNIRRQQENLRDQHEKLNMLLDAQIKNEALFNERFERNEERFARNEERFARNEERFARNEERFTRIEHAIERLIAAQKHTDEKLHALIDSLGGKRFGDSLA